jgi:RNA polymerase sigma-70 factor, ECF subfamily
MTSVLRWDRAGPAKTSRQTAAGPAERPLGADSSARRMEAALTDRTRNDQLDTGATSDDRTIVDAVLAGDRDSFRRLVDREGPSLVSTCARILGDRLEAEDVAQEAFVIAYRSLGTWRADGAFGAWLARIGVRLAIRRASQRKQVTWLDPLAAEADQPGQDRYRTSVIADGLDPAQAILRTERDAEIRAAVASLDEPYREVVALRFFAECSLAEIAEATDRPMGTVKTHLHRGLARLRRALEADR